MNREKKTYIEGVYNYCDRWCEKCRFTSNCLLFSQESKISTYEILHNGDLSNIGEVFKKEFDELIDDSEDQDKFGFYDDDEDFLSDDDIEESFKNIESKEDKEKDELEIAGNPIDELSNEYFRKAHLLVSEIDKKYDQYSFPKEKLNDPSFKKLHDNFEVVSWFHSLIHVKLKRALGGKNEMEREDDEELKEISKYDMDGTAKIAVISINRSVNSLNNLYNILPEFSTEISELLVLLGKVLNLAETEFPDYNKFIRPGFDTIQ
jgi:hypothetical protein